MGTLVVNGLIVSKKMVYVNNGNNLGLYNEEEPKLQLC